MILKSQYRDEEVIEEISFTPITDANNDVVGISCFSRDITPQHTHMETIEKQNDQLRQIAWIQSHEVRSPVATILGLTQLFNKEDVADPENCNIINMVEEAASNLDNVIRKINAHTRTKE